MKNKLKAILAIALLNFFSNLSAQTEITPTRFCGSEVPDMKWENEFQKLVKSRVAAKSGERTQSIVYTIPVIIHVIHGGQVLGTYPNVAQSQLNSQIQVLNNDYAGAGFNSGNYPLSAYSNWAAAQNIVAASLEANGRVKIADCEVQFCLATKDTLGNLLPEPGIERINWTSRAGWVNPGGISSYAQFKSFIDNTVKPQTIWNVTRYLNIWVTDSDIGNVNLLGYATFPPLSGLNGLGSGPSLGTSTTDGFWCYTKAFGSAGIYPGGTYYVGYTRGRTSTHEIGHWLGLRHIWGDGDCFATDFCDDTPSASASNFGAPAYPLKANVCSGNSPNGEMFMNFMDYTNDNSKYMFTTDQANRIQTAMANCPYRMYLGTHGLCTVAEVAASASFNNVVTACTGVGMQLGNTSNGFPPPSYTWTATGGTFTPGNNVTSPMINFSTPGTYVITLSAANGTLSATSKTVTVNSPALFLAATPQYICPGGSATLTASGVSTYTWEPGGNVNWETIESPNQTQTYTCSGTEVNGCTTTGTVAIIVSTCVGINGPLAGETAFYIYPNPAKDWLNIGHGASAEIIAEITDALGRQVLNTRLSFTKNGPEQQLNIAALENGVYIVKLHSKEGQQVVRFIKE